MSYVYANDWIYGDGITDCFTNKFDAILEMMDYAIEDEFTATFTSLADMEKRVEVFSEIMQTLYHDHYIDDACYLTTLQIREFTH